MDSPYLSSSSSSAPRTRADSTFSIHLTDSGAIQKRNNSRSSRPRSISATTLERHPELLPEPVQDRLNLNSVSLPSDDWKSAKHSPRPRFLQDPFSPPVSASQQSPQPDSASSQPKDQAIAKDSHETPSHTYNKPLGTSTNMASLGYLPAPHYGNLPFQDPSFDSNYQQMDSHSSHSHSHSHPPNNFNFLFGTSASPSQQTIYTSGPLQMEPAFTAAPLEPSLSHVSEPSLNALNRDTSPFHQSNYDSLDYSLSRPQNQMPVSRSISHSPLSQHLGPLTPPLTSGLDAPPQMAGSPPLQASIEPVQSPGIYEVHSYSSSYATPSAQAHLYPTPQSYSYPPPQATSSRQQARKSSTESHVRVLNQKPKPQCWEHGCNGREFSTFSNLLRHQREKSGTAAKSYCPKCGAEFTRTTARNGHLAHEKCSKQRRPSEIK